MPSDPFKFSMLIGIVFAAIVLGGLAVVHIYEPETVAPRSNL